MENHIRTQDALLESLVCTSLQMYLLWHLGFWFLGRMITASSNWTSLFPFPALWLLFCPNSKPPEDREPNWSRPRPIDYAEGGACHPVQVKTWLPVPLQGWGVGRAVLEGEAPIGQVRLAKTGLQPCGSFRVFKENQVKIFQLAGILGGYLASRKYWKIQIFF